MTKFIYKTCYFNQVISFYYFILTSRAWISRQGNYDIYKILKLVFLYFLPFLFFFFVFGLYKVERLALSSFFNDYFQITWRRIRYEEKLSSNIYSYIVFNEIIRKLSEKIYIFSMRRDRTKLAINRGRKFYPTSISWFKRAAN